jgi:polar amino acid transport system permease protein
MVEMLVENMPFLLGGAKNTIIVSLLGMIIAFIIGVPIGLIRLSKTPWIRSSALIYIEFWRGVPFIISLLFLYFALPEVLKLFGKIEISQFTAMLLTCVLWTSANAAEIVRGAVQAVPFGQTEAGMALGMTYLQRMRLIILPQATRVMIPPMIGLFTLLLKGTAIGFIIEFRELIRVGQITIERLIMVRRETASIEIYTLIMIMYFLMCYPLTRLSAYFEKRLSKGRN